MINLAMVAATTMCPIPAIWFNGEIFLGYDRLPPEFAAKARTLHAGCVQHYPESPCAGLLQLAPVVQGPHRVTCVPAVEVKG